MEEERRIRKRRRREEEGRRRGGRGAEEREGGENERMGRRGGVLGDAGSRNPGRRPRVPASLSKAEIEKNIKRYPERTLKV